MELRESRSREALTNVAFPGDLAVYLVGRLGMADALAVAAFIWSWGQTYERLRHRVPTWREFSEEWGQSEATTYRELRLFRKAWPKDRNPERVWRWMSDRMPPPGEDPTA